MAQVTRRERKALEEKKLVRDFFKSKREGVFVEVGAHEPTSVESQSWHLERDLGWSGILVEPNPHLSEMARQSRPKARVFQCACTSPAKTGKLTLYIPVSNGRLMTGHASVEKNADDFDYVQHQAVSVEARTLDSLLEESGLQAIDLLSVDVEGTEIDVLKGFDLKRFAPALILMEDKLLYLEKHRYLKRFGYRLVKRTKQNNWYIAAGEAPPPQTVNEQLKLFKKLYVSIWWRKLKFSWQSKSLKPLLAI